MTRIPSNHHWVKFEFKDWLIDGAIRSCDAATRGIYMDLFCLAMTSKKTGVLALNDKQICKQLAIKPLQFERVIKNLIAVKLCSRGRGNELILTQFVDDIDLKDAEIVPNRTDMEPNRCRTGKENVENPPKIDPPIKEKNRNRIDPPYPQTKDKVVPIHSHHESFNQILLLLMDRTSHSEPECRGQIEQWVQQIGDLQTVIGIVRAASNKNDPFSYISKCVGNHRKKNASQPTKQDKITPSWALSRGKHADDPEFQRLSADNQSIALQLIDGKTPKWLVRFHENHNPAAYKFYEKHRQNQEKAA
ncbi:hypothetical protein [Commensalibacter oyaizuii]|uniref:Uncharacterized protein n=1 Tax=Commensalibacter oyaizuii TaxID=3043873 RepID=A0ABT6Q550_9PROT|nr:hypothetical protein [Commensalibacter sp. TBRC 16381]MDI2091604.1 hypothetical protein [Commensalibacter sp. TBRC 16381]